MCVSTVNKIKYIILNTENLYQHFEQAKLIKVCLCKLYSYEKLTEHWR